MKNISDLLKEGLFDNAVNSKASSGSDNGPKLSPIGQKTLENGEKKAGDKWSGIQKDFTTAVTIVDSVINANKGFFDNASKVLGTNVQNICDITSEFITGLKADSNVGKKIEEWFGDTAKFKDPLTTLVFNIVNANIFKKFAVDANTLGQINQLIYKG